MIDGGGKWEDVNGKLKVRFLKVDWRGELRRYVVKEEVRLRGERGRKVGKERQRRGGKKDG